ncbi:MAG: DASS family sodium-coupled anion symporter [Methanobacteriaceae archaeon]|nr:DASS family sodium-coupled anion symporter [Methanobacteriaceae archaeon]
MNKSIGVNIIEITKREIKFLLISIIAYVIVMLIPLEGLNPAGHAALSLFVFAVFMWAFEPVPLAVTSLILMFLQPLTGVCSFEDAAIGFANPIIFLMIGGFVLALAIQKSGLARRLTYILLNKIGITPNRSLFTAVFATGLLSAWIENIVAFAMLMPIIKEIVELMGVKNPEEGNSNFAKTMILGACFASLAGGLGTQIGTAPNLMAAAYTNISFLSWMIFAFPLAIVLLLVIWKFLPIVFPFEVEGIVGGKNTLQEKLDSFGKVTKTEKVTAVILIFTIILWLTSNYTGVDTYSVALIGASLYFIFGIIKWEDVQSELDWGLIIFFGGALSLGSVLLNSGAATWLIDNLISFLGAGTSPIIIMIIFMIVGVILTQLMSNIALAAVLIPLSVTLAESTNLLPATYAIPIAIACSLSFTMPMADPTVAMAYGTNYVKVKEILKGGVPIIIVGIILTIIVMLTLAKPLTGL